MKRIQLYILILTVCCLLISGCSSSSVDETAPSNETATETIITEAETGNDSISIEGNGVVSDTAETCTDEDCEHDHEYNKPEVTIEIPEPIPHGGGGNSGGQGGNNTTDKEETYE